MDLEDAVACKAEVSESPGDGCMDGYELVQEEGGAPERVVLPHIPAAVGTLPAESDDVDFCGDALLLLTGPFYPGSTSLTDLPDFAVPVDGALDPQMRLTVVQRSLDQFLRGSLTFGNPPVNVLTHLAGSDEFNARLTTIVQEATLLPVELNVTGTLFPDGYGSVAVHMRIADGWSEARRKQLIDGFGPKGRDDVTARIRDELLPALTAMSDQCRQGPPCPTVLPYFNLTYAGSTTHPTPGRATLSHSLRHLIYPRSAEPIPSESTWPEEFFYPGYAFFLLASRNPHDTLGQLEHLLGQLNVHYARLERSANAAERIIRESALDEDPELVIGLERRLRADYQALVRPTFSYDFHVLKLRDSVLKAWETEKVRERTDTLLQMARYAVERKLEHAQMRRVKRVNQAVTIVAILSFVQCVDAAASLWSTFFG
ncbi:hypothetical protein FNH09_39915 [Streptomyces adustus]|uniref:Uncharacterized protein n=1 Tax=Streptomyces adustus TaxID=1609272 RepID=A0A5N8VTA4_9ACTN|nr:hypothetical protein [Streptomyces adustus]MPY37165.1 hypothetical protein [Streptomyces adustus]